MSILLDDRVIGTGSLALHRMNLILVRLFGPFEWVLPYENLLMGMVVHDSVAPNSGNQCLLDHRLPASRLASSNQNP